MFKNHLIHKIIIFASIILKIWEVVEKCYSVKLKTPVVNINQIKTQLELTETTFMNNSYKLMPLISKFILLDHIICMLKLEDHQLWMVWLIGIKVERKKGFLLFWLLKKNSYVQKLYSNFNKIFVDLTCWEQKESHMYVM